MAAHGNVCLIKHDCYLFGKKKKHVSLWMKNYWCCIKCRYLKVLGRPERSISKQNIINHKWSSSYQSPKFVWSCSKFGRSRLHISSEVRCSITLAHAQPAAPLTVSQSPRRFTPGGQRKNLKVREQVGSVERDGACSCALMRAACSNAACLAPGAGVRVHQVASLIRCARWRTLTAVTYTQPPTCAERYTQQG